MKNSKNVQRAAASENVASHPDPVHGESELVLGPLPRRVQGHDHHVCVSRAAETLHLSLDLLFVLGLGLGFWVWVSFLFGRMGSRRRRDGDGE